ncbi:hypothetical protein D0T24_24285 [Duganella sp. BJB480]|nr:hypothetical protein D0T23_26755 [Duganella sp. BJB475]RFP25345.1 hypothetical protein D0T21_27785 [Duganella sp. BJB476]RFP31552.1 hypothetical protein D0T24_24285 [Duganella sp. BJB480]
MTALNNTKGCVRFYINGQQDLASGKAKSLGAVRLNNTYAASVFAGACSGAALKTVSFTPTNVHLVWVVNR